MSIKAMSMVWERSRQRGSALLMLLAIADYAKEDGTDAWPSYSTLARKTRMVRRNVIEVIKKLEDDGELSVRRGDGPNGCNFYDILFPGEVQFTTKKPEKKVVKPASLPSESQFTRLVNPSSPGLVNPSSPDSSCNHHITVKEPLEGAAEKTPPARDYLTDVLAHSQKPDRAGIADPSQDVEAWMQTADEFVNIYHQRTGLWPDTNVQKPAIQALAENGVDLELWDQVVTAWVKVGWNKRNVAGMIDCYERGEVPSTRRNGGKHESRHNESGSRVRSDSLSEQQRAALKNV